MTTSVDCELVRISAMAAADGEEPPTSQEQIDGHIRECAACQEEIKRWLARPPLPPTIRRAESMEHVWPRLKPRLEEQVLDQSRNHPPNGAPVPRVGNGLFRRRVAWSGAAICLLAMAATGWWMVQHERSGDGRPPSITDDPGRLVLRIDQSAIGDEPIDTSGSGQPAPFGDEAHADDVALAVVGESFERNGKKFIRMQLVTAYKGRLPTGRFDADDRQVYHLECSVPRRSLGLRSQLFKPGAHVGLYLDHDPAHGWTATSVRDVAGREESWRRRVKRFCDVQMAAEAADPAARYRELLEVEQPVLLDVEAYHALMYSPSSHALPIIRQLWERSTTLSIDLTQTGGSDVGAALSLARILARMHDEESIDSVLRHGLKQQLGQRVDYFGLLPDLCRNADTDTILMVRRELKRFLDAASVVTRDLEKLDRLPMASAPMNADLTTDCDRAKADLDGAKAADEKLEELLGKRPNEEREASPTTQ